jgi:hypothetical protein
VYLSPATNLEHFGSNNDPFSNRQRLNQFRSTNTFGQVMNLYNTNPQEPSSSKNDVFVNINLYLKRDALPTSLGRFNSRTPKAAC